MTEFEIKLEVPEGRARAVAAALREGASTDKLHAIYFDTPDALLRRHGIALRLRRTGNRWVQTAKAAGDKLLARLEHEVDVPGPLRKKAVPLPDLARHRGTPIGKLIAQAVKKEKLRKPPSLVALFETDVQRLARTVQVGLSKVEIAFDRGRVTGGGLSQPLCEIEFELKEGKAADAVELARSWGTEHGLWLSTVSKAEKGIRLTEGGKPGPAVGARPCIFPAHAGAADMAAAVSASCLDQVTANASEVASGNDADEHIHQLRVGIRRLRTAMRELGGLGVDLGAKWEPALVHVFRELGRHRDSRHVMRSLEPAIEHAGGPALDTAALEAPVRQPGDVVRSPAFQDALLGLVALAHAEASPSPKAKPGTPKKHVRRRLDKLLVQCVRDGKRFVKLDRVRQHRVRKRLKRLRYLTELTAPLFNARDVEDFLSRLKPVQDALGAYNDELTAIDAYREMASRDPRAWFGVGWLSARRHSNAQACAKAMREFSRAGKFWD